ncbi:hypothetical protein M413DRAFT_384126 [Hebeloma cylindrosporum]|uniref:Uncharacterized protein n=1 Tax=Hebeloma cylindrosporum TaxID=76867 RepID=A0A0C2Y164_HEBCY|nr:hypothetical protein M413DRAFT_384126 [Hebeloma cylindrosporum h7]
MCFGSTFVLPMIGTKVTSGRSSSIVTSRFALCSNFSPCILVRNRMDATQLPFLSRITFALPHHLVYVVMRLCTVYDLWGNEWLLWQWLAEFTATARKFGMSPAPSASRCGSTFTIDIMLDRQDCPRSPITRKKT